LLKICSGTKLIFVEYLLRQLIPACARYDWHDMLMFLATNSAVGHRFSCFPRWGRHRWSPNSIATSQPTDYAENEILLLA